MRSRMCLACGLVLVPLLASEAPGQWRVLAGEQRQVNPEGHVWRECSVAARLGDADEVVVAANFMGPGGGTEYAVSLDGGESFPNVPEQLVHLTDLQVGAPARAPRGPDQVMPSIEIDACGGVSLVFYDNRNDPDLTDDDHWLDLYYVRITDFGTMDQDIYWERLTQPEPPDPAGFLLPEEQIQFLGDYHHMAVAGPQQRTLYPAYIAMAKDENENWTEQNCYLHKIRIFCLSDLNLNGQSDAQDVALFETAYDSRERAADLNRDGAVDQLDHTLFWDVYRNGCERR